MLKELSLIGAALLLSSCTAFLTEYQRPELPEAEAYARARFFQGDPVGARFWAEFGDSRLDALIDRALEHNYDLRTAYVNVQKALLSVDIAGTERHPTASAAVGADAQRALSYHQSLQKATSSSFALSYQIDLFGEIEASNLQALEEYRATAYDYWAMRLTVIDTVAAAYWQYCYAREAVELGEQDLRDSQQRVNLIRNKYAAGSVDSLDVSDSKINHLQVLQTLDSRRAELAQARTALATLLGVTADQDFDIASLDTAAIPQFSLEIPARLLARRPDLMAREAELRSCYAGYDEARLSWFPDFTLTGSLAMGNTGSFARFLADPVGALGAAITLPFVNFNQLLLEERSALKDIELASLDFVSTYIAAVQEVFDEVTNIELYRKDVSNTEQEYKLSIENYRMYYMRYEAGLVSVSDFLDAADTMRNAEINYLAAKRNNLQATMSLMVALGGDTESTLAAAAGEMPSAAAGN